MDLAAEFHRVLVLTNIYVETRSWLNLGLGIKPIQLAFTDSLLCVLPTLLSHSYDKQPITIT